MKNAIIILFAAIACSAFTQYNDEPYTVQFEIIERGNGQALLVINLKLAEGSHFVSPYSSDYYSGRFGVYFESDQWIAIEGLFTEAPRSVKAFDPHPFVNSEINWVRTNTRYEYPIQIDADGDFEAQGVVRFTIEPRCTLEQIPFVVRRKSGKLTIDMNGC